MVHYQNVNFFQYFNVEHFSNAPHKVIALPTLWKKNLSLSTLFFFFISVRYIDPWLLLNIATHIVIALPTIATVGRVITIERLIRKRTTIKLREEETKKSPI